MWRKIVAVLLIFGWVSLSGFDVVEDLDGVPGQAALLSASDDRSSVKLSGDAPLANNIVESANRTQQSDLTLVNFIPTRCDCDTLLGFRRHSQLHKLYRVFLI